MPAITFQAALDVQKSNDEIMAMSPAERRTFDDTQRLIVFGHDHMTDRHGNPIEQGIGSQAWLEKHPDQAVNHLASIAKYEGAEAADRARAKLAR